MFVLENVTVELGGKAILRDVSLSIAPGERVALLGVNGAGKSTLLKLLDGLVHPATGTLRWRGETLDARALAGAAFRRRFRSQVGLVFQNVDAMLFHPTVFDELAFGPRQLGVADVGPRVRGWAERLGIAPLLDRPPFELSGGEKKRVALAAVLCLEPEVLLLDEATAGLDPASQALLVDLLEELPELTVIASTHDASLAGDLGTRAVLLAPDRPGVLYDGPPQGLFGNAALLVESGLAHRHTHRHGDRRHEHFHLHAGDRDVPATGGGTAGHGREHGHTEDP
jgi:cobalt/nickel transport system ATP-binding protein